MPVEEKEQPGTEKPDQGARGGGVGGRNEKAIQETHLQRGRLRSLVTFAKVSQQRGGDRSRLHLFRKLAREGERQSSGQRDQG